MKLFDVYPLYDIELVRAKGSYVFDSQNTKYLDLYGGHAVISIGHNHDFYVETLKNQADKIIFYSNSVQNSLQTELAEKLGNLSGYPNYELFLCNSGAEANENALKLASFRTGKRKVIAFKNAFHGRTSAAVSVTDNPALSSELNKVHEVVFAEFNMESVSKLAENQDVAAIIIEGIQGVAGIIEPNSAFLKGLELFCKTQNIVLILDEIQSGYGRTGKFFAHQHADIKPDIITTAKGMGNGFPIAGVLIGEGFEAKHGLLGTTFGGNHFACAAGIAVLDIIKSENLTENAKNIGSYLVKKLSKLTKIKEIRGKGLMIGIEFDFNIQDVRKNLLFDKKIFTGYAQKNILRLLPPLCLSLQDADYFLDSLHEILEKE